MTTAEQVPALKWQWDEAWAHYRHLETMRGQFLGFFFAALLGLTAFAANEVADDALATSGSLVAFSAVTLGLDLLAVTLLLALVRIGEVLAHYQKIILAIEREIRGRLDPAVTEGWPELPRGSASTGFVSSLRSTQGAAEAVLKLAVLALPLGLIATALRSATVGGIPWMTVILCIACLGVGLALSAGCLRVLWSGAPMSSSRPR
jgi:hypothetical protein